LFLLVDFIYFKSFSVTSFTHFDGDARATVWLASAVFSPLTVTAPWRMSVPPRSGWRTAALGDELAQANVAGQGVFHDVVRQFLVLHRFLKMRPGFQGCLGM
jgi:hypothetical protein